MPDLLIELFSEEIPARMQPAARTALRKLVTDGLLAAGLKFTSAGAFSTPRRLVLAVEGLSPRSRATSEERKGPRVDAPDQAIEGFLRATGLTRDQLEIRDDKKNQAYFAIIEKPGREAAEIVAEILGETIRQFPWPASMRWGSGNLRWVRPLHRILCILHDETETTIVPFEIEGIRAGDVTEGHRFMAPGAFPVSSFDDHAARLRRARVMLDPEERAGHIRQGANNLAFASGLEVVEDKALLEEVAGLVEWPVPLMGRIPDQFLDLPPEVLKTSMREHQKFFSLRNPGTGRIEGFVTVANIEAPDDGRTILAGNLKVLTARLSDARFFWENDLREARAGMGNWAEGLESVTFQSKLGSQADRVARIAALAREIAPLVGADPDEAEEAARIAKLDLRSAMVGEFPELQGVMGRYYALEAGKSQAVADAARDHWSPKGESDAVPTAPVSVAVALADKLDTLTGFWAIDEKPTGSKDPFALRRAALGIIRLVLGNGLRLSLAPSADQSYRLVIYSMADQHLLAHVVVGADEAKSITTKKDMEALRDFKIFKFDRASLNAAIDAGELGTFKRGEVGGSRLDKILPTRDDTLADLLSFFHDRLKVHLRDKGIRHDAIDAVLAMPGNDDLVLVVKRAEALAAFLRSDDGENLLQGFKRANNLLIQAEARDGVEYSFGADPKLADDPSEKALFAALSTAESEITPALQIEDFATVMAAMARLRAPLDAFFDAVQINADNQILRRNRLNLLHQIRQTCSSVADLTRIEG